MSLKVHDDTMNLIAEGQRAVWSQICRRNETKNTHVPISIVIIVLKLGNLIGRIVTYDALRQCS